MRWLLLIPCIAHALAATDSLYCTCAGCYWFTVLHMRVAATDSLYCTCAGCYRFTVLCMRWLLLIPCIAHALAVTDSLYCACAGCCWFTVLRKCWLLLIQCIVHALTVTDSLYCAWAGCYWFTILSMHWLFLSYCIAHALADLWSDGWWSAGEASRSMIPLVTLGTAGDGRIRVQEIWTVVNMHWYCAVKSFDKWN